MKRIIGLLLMAPVALLAAGALVGMLVVLWYSGGLRAFGLLAFIFLLVGMFVKGLGLLVE